MENNQPTLDKFQTELTTKYNRINYKTISTEKGHVEIYDSGTFFRTSVFEIYLKELNNLVKERMDWRDWSWKNYLKYKQ